MHMSFPESYYVTLRKIPEMAFPLGFATPDGTDAAAKKRKGTADYWAQLPQTITFDNEPISGFSFGNSVTRYSTSNKFVRVSDPRGFVLEISIANMCDIIDEHTIVKGDIKGLFVWGRDRATNILISADDPEYIKSLAPKETLEIGDWYVIEEGNEYLEPIEYCYLGIHHAILGIEHYEYIGSYKINKTIKSKEYKDDPKKWHISSALERRRKYQKDLPPPEMELHMRRSKPKKFRKIVREGKLNFVVGVAYPAKSSINISTVKIKS